MSRSELYDIGGGRMEQCSWRSCRPNATRLADQPVDGAKAAFPVSAGYWQALLQDVRRLIDLSILELAMSEEKTFRASKRARNQAASAPCKTFSYG